MSWRLVNQATARWLNATVVTFFWGQRSRQRIHWQDLHWGREMFQAPRSRADRKVSRNS